jgi:glycosyltransferase involved in cell wall biosynthesis
MPRIAHVVSSPEGVGGAERVVASLVHGALDRGWEPLVVNPFSIDPNGSELAEICEPAKYVGRSCSSWRELPGLRSWLRSVVRDFAPDVLHAHLFHAEVAIASLPLPRGTRSLLTHHHGDHFIYLDRRRNARLDRWAGSRFDSVVAISEWVRRFLIERYGYPDRQVEMIRNGWEGEPLPTQNGTGVPTVLCVGNFREQKGHRDLVAAFERVHSELPDARLMLVGDGELRGEIEETVRRLGISGSVHFAGELEDVWPQYAAADLFALASLYEPLGIAVIEAMAAGLPIVATNVGGIRELVEPDATGLLVPPHDVDALANAMLALLRSSDLRSRLSEASRIRAEEMRRGKTVSQYFSLYGAVLDRG